MAETIEFTNTSGATAQGVKQYAPMVEAATSTHCLYDDAQCKMEDQNIVSANIMMADSCFFDVFPQKILMGKAKADFIPTLILSHRFRNGSKDWR